MSTKYLASIEKQFQYYRTLGDRTFAQVSDEDLFWQYNPESNSIAIIVKHIWGNALSRWTDFLNSDGEKEWRQREAEFDADISSRQEMLAKWNEAWECLFKAIELLTEEHLSQIVYIRNQGHTVTEALNRQLAHYAYHVGQIVYLGRMRRGKDWQSLSIPRGGTAEFNRKKFSQPKQEGHFTDEFLKEE